MSSEKKIFRCQLCQREYDKKFNFDYHYAHHFNARPFACDFPGCSNSYKTKADLRQHQKSHEKLLGITFMCFECNLPFETSTKLNIHRRDHHSLKSETWCEICNRNFTSLKNHQDVVHRKIRLYVCDIDGKKFGKMHGLTRHIKAVHLGLTPFQCKQCNKKFKEAGALKKHMIHHSRASQKFLRHRNPRPAPTDWGEDEILLTEKIKFKCSCCSLKFSSQKFLSKHQKVVHSDAKLVCDICNQKFLNKNSISRHLLNDHTENKNQAQKIIEAKNYKCGACKKILSSKNALERHKKNIHMDIFEFLCEHCSAPFRDRSALNKHLSRVHEVQIDSKKQFDCVFCLKSFSLSSNQEKHEKACRIKKQKYDPISQESEFGEENVLEDQQTESLKVETEDPFEVTEVDFIESDVEDDNIDFEDNFEEDFETKDFNLENQLDEDSEQSFSELTQNSTTEMKFVEELISVEPVLPKFLKLSTFLESRPISTSADKSKFESEKCQETLSKTPESKNFKIDTELEPEIDEKILQQIFTGRTLNKDENYFECEICSQNFEKLLDLKLHCVQEHRIKKFKCNHCRKSFDSKISFRQHWTLQHPKTSYNKSLTIRNYAIPNESHTCPHCSKILSQKESLKRHIELMHNENRATFYCDQCALKFKDQRTLKYHVLKAHSTNLDEKIIVRRRKTTQQINCPTCGEVAYGKTGLLIHQWNKHYNFKIRDKHRYHCLICEEVLNSRATALRHHRQVHQEGKLLVRTCHACSSDFKLFDDFKRHIEYDHVNVRICLICGIELMTSIDFLTHMKSHRTVPECEKKLFCDICGFKAQQKVTIELHMVRSHNGKKKEYSSTCEICGAFFVCYQTFNAHRKNNCQSQRNKKLSENCCSHCEKAFSSNRDLKDHEESHFSEVKPYRCDFPECEKEYTSISSYRWHVKYTHEENKNQCKNCSSFFQSREKLNAHIDEAHPETRKFSCSYCNRTFATQTAISRHINACEQIVG